jgi:hypothetical protein
VLARARLGDDALLAHAARDQDLRQRVIDLVRARVIQVLALQVDFRPSAAFGEAFREIQGGGPAHEVPQQPVQFGLETRIRLDRRVKQLQFLERGHEDFGGEFSAVRAESAPCVRQAVRSGHKSLKGNFWGPYGGAARPF